MPPKSCCWDRYTVPISSHSPQPVRERGEEKERGGEREGEGERGGEREREKGRGRKGEGYLYRTLVLVPY